MEKSVSLKENELCCGGKDVRSGIVLDTFVSDRMSNLGYCTPESNLVGFNGQYYDAYFGERADLLLAFLAFSSGGLERALNRKREVIKDVLFRVTCEDGVRVFEFGAVDTTMATEDNVRNLYSDGFNALCENIINHFTGSIPVTPFSPDVYLEDYKVMPLLEEGNRSVFLVDGNEMEILDTHWNSRYSQGRNICLVLNESYDQIKYKFYKRDDVAILLTLIINGVCDISFLPGKISIRAKSTLGKLSEHTHTILTDKIDAVIKSIISFFREEKEYYLFPFFATMSPYDIIYAVLYEEDLIGESDLYYHGEVLYSMLEKPLRAKLEIIDGGDFSSIKSAHSDLKRWSENLEKISQENSLLSKYWGDDTGSVDRMEVGFNQYRDQQIAARDMADKIMESHFGASSVVILDGFGNQNVALELDKSMSDAVKRYIMSDTDYGVLGPKWEHIHDEFVKNVVEEEKGSTLVYGCSELFYNATNLCEQMMDLQYSGLWLQPEVTAIFRISMRVSPLAIKKICEEFGFWSVGFSPGNFRGCEWGYLVLMNGFKFSKPMSLLDYVGSYRKSLGEATNMVLVDIIDRIFSGMGMKSSKKYATNPCGIGWKRKRLLEPLGGFIDYDGRVEPYDKANKESVNANTDCG